jgi:hypothetical protein
MTLTARGRTWAALLAGAAALGITAGAVSTITPDLTDLRHTAERVYGAVNAGDLGALYAADPDCDGLDLTGRATERTSRIRFHVTDTSVVGNFGAVDVETEYLTGAPSSYGVADWQLTADGTWRLAANGRC